MEQKLELYRKLALLVKEEANNLRINATVDEIGRLDIERLNPQSSTLCVYGQMTGDCESDRSIELINSCCSSRILNVKYNNFNSRSFRKGHRFNNNVSGIRADKMLFSPIEIFLWYSTENDRVRLVEYIKGGEWVEFDYENWYLKK